jgi:hypothetical protein
MRETPPVPEPYSSMPMTFDASYGAGWHTSSQFQCWPEATMSIPMASEHSSWNGLLTEPFIMPNSETQYLQNGNLEYSSMMTAHNSLQKSDLAYNSGHLWQPTEINGLPHPAYFFEESDMATVASSLSPRSLFSEPSDHKPSFTADMVVECPSPIESWTGNEAHSCNMLQSHHEYESSSGVIPLDSSVTRSSLHISGLRLPGTRRDNFTGSFSHLHTLVDTTEMQYDFRSVPSYSPEGGASNPSHSYAPSSTMMPSELSYQQVHAQEQQGNSLPHRTNNMLSTHPTPPRQFDERVYSTTSMAMPPDMQVPLATGAQAQRTEEDKILLEGKQNGLTYKEIRKKMRTRVAESTLRGRYRSLTKERKDRVRKPVWTPKDVRIEIYCVSCPRLIFDTRFDSLKKSSFPNCGDLTIATTEPRPALRSWRRSLGKEFLNILRWVVDHTISETRLARRSGQRLMLAFDGLQLSGTTGISLWFSSSPT